MNRKTWTWFYSILVMVALVLLMAQTVAASPTAGLPPVKEPASVRYDIVGTVSSPELSATGLTFAWTGDGALADGKRQENVTLGISRNGETSDRFTVTSDAVYAEGKYYFRVGLTGGVSDNRWYYVNLPAGVQTGSTMTGLDPMYAEAWTTTPLGKDTVNGVATTKYRVDVDLDKLKSLMGITRSASSEFAELTKLTLYQWVGDADQYLYEQQQLVEQQVPIGGGAEIGVNNDVTITFHDFDTPITIDVPANAIPLSAIGRNSVSAMTLGGLPGILGFEEAFSSIAVFAGLAVSGPSGSMSSMPAGMPRTGAGASAVPVGLVLLSALVLGGGLALRRRARE